MSQESDLATAVSNAASDIGGFIRAQREAAQVSVRQLAEKAGVSNPYLSQIERGLRRPSAEVLNQIAKALRVSAEVLYVRAGILDRSDASPVRDAIIADTFITERQKQVLLDVYSSFVQQNAEANAELAQSHDTSIALTQRYVEVQTEIGVLNSQQKRIQALCGKIGYDHSHIKNFEQLRADLECIAAALEPRIGLEKKDLEAFVKQLKGGSHITEHTLSRPDELERTIAEATIVPADTVRQLLDRLKPHAETIRLGKKPLHQIDFGMDAPEGYASPIEYAAASIEKLDGIVKKTADALSIDPTQWKASKGPSLGNQVAALRDDFLEMLTPKGTDMTQFSSKTLKEALEILKAIEEQRMLKERASKLAERRVRDKDRRDAKRDAKFAESASWAEYVEHPGANEPGAKTRPPTITRGEGR